MTALQTFFLSLIGLAAGVGSGLFGIGGGVIIVPLLVFIYGLEQRTASATSLIAMILPVGILGVWEYYKAGIVNSSHIKMGLLVSIGMFLGAFLGSKLSMALPVKYLSRGFSLLLIYVAIRLWNQSGK
jgi:uncharacterized membrane protein YfcA